MPARSCAPTRTVVSREKPLFSQASSLRTLSRLISPLRGEPAQHPHAPLLGDGGDGLWRHCRRGPEAHGFGETGGIVDRLGHPVGDATVVMDAAVEGGTEAMDEDHRPEAKRACELAPLV